MTINPNDIVLDTTAVDCAIEAANAAAHAGDDEQAQLMAGIRAYLASLHGDEA